MGRPFRIVVCATCGLLALGFVAPTRVREQTVRVWLAKDAIDMGSIIRDPENWFESVDYPKASAPSCFVQDMAAAKGKVLKTSLKKGEPLTSNPLLKECVSGLYSGMPQGLRAIGFPASTHNFWGRPRRVDILVTRMVDGITRSNLVVASAPVVGTSCDSGMVTVGLSAKDVLNVHLATKTGTMTLTSADVSVGYLVSPLVDQLRWAT